MKVSSVVSVSCGLSALSLILLSFGCAKKGASLEGHVIDIVALHPITSISVTATTQTDIKEELDSAESTGITDKRGKFRISGLLSGRIYSLKGEGQNYILIPAEILTPEVGKTRILQSPLLGFHSSKDGLKSIPRTESNYLVFESLLSEREVRDSLISKTSDNFLLYRRSRGGRGRYFIFSNDINCKVINQVFTDNITILSDLTTLMGPVKNASEQAWLYELLCKPETAGDLYKKIGLQLAKEKSARMIVFTINDEKVLGIISDRHIKPNIPPNCGLVSRIERIHLVQ